jgi:hypothetical protein
VPSGSGAGAQGGVDDFTGFTWQLRRASEGTHAHVRRPDLQVRQIPTGQTARRRRVGAAVQWLAR